MRPHASPLERRSLRAVLRGRTKIGVDSKTDASPVTIADREAEAVMRAIITERFPDHTIFGEEAGLSAGQSGEQGYVWILDPIDGTKSFITGACAPPPEHMHRTLALYFLSQ
jgi:fructose-1,6-bisphosphatase/inositol monophosphatase family enzyme